MLEACNIYHWNYFIAKFLSFVPCTDWKYFYLTKISELTKYLQFEERRIMVRTKFLMQFISSGSQEKKITKCLIYFFNKKCTTSSLGESKLCLLLEFIHFMMITSDWDFMNFAIYNGKNLWNINQSRNLNNS
jgi:hypothetical protein